MFDFLKRLKNKIYKNLLMKFTLFLKKVFFKKNWFIKIYKKIIQNIVNINIFIIFKIIKFWGFENNFIYYSSLKG